MFFTLKISHRYFKFSHRCHWKGWSLSIDAEVRKHIELKTGAWLIVGAHLIKHRTLVLVCPLSIFRGGGGTSDVVYGWVFHISSFVVRGIGKSNFSCLVCLYFFLSWCFYYIFLKNVFYFSWCFYSISKTKLWKVCFFLLICTLEILNSCNLPISSFQPLNVESKY